MQNKVKEFNELVKNHHKKTMSVEARLLNIQSELGELSKEVLKSTKYGTMQFIPSNDYQMEFGDVYYALLSLASETNIDAEQCLEESINKMKERIKNKGNLGSNS